MKKLKIYLLFLILAACTQEESLVQEAPVKVGSGRLVFKDDTTFAKIFLGISNHEIKVNNNRLYDLDYTPLQQSYKDANKKELSIFDIYGLGVVLNQNSEFQVGDKIYYVTEDKVYTKNLKNEILEESKSISYLYPKGKIKNDRDFNIDRYIYLDTNYNIRSRFIDVHMGLLYHFFYSYLEMEDGVFSPFSAYYFRFQSSSCVTCNLPSSPPPQYTYNVTSVQYPIGYMTTSQFNDYGCSAGITAYVAPSSTSGEYLIGDDTFH